MSYIEFSSREGAVEIGGRERARMGILVDGIAWLMGSRGRPRGNPREEWEAKIRYCGPFAEDNFGERLGWLCLIGDDVTKLIAHVHGQCEIHGWVHPDDGDWFADLIQGGIDRGLLSDDRPGRYGSWGDVADLARKSTTPLVSSYSVTESWPDPWTIAQERPDLFNPVGPATDDDVLYDAWDALSDEERGRIADAAIESIGPRWHPAEWGTHWTALVMGRNPYAQVASRSGEQPPPRHGVSSAGSAPDERQGGGTQQTADSPGPCPRCGEPMFWVPVGPPDDPDSERVPGHDCVPVPGGE